MQQVYVGVASNVQRENSIRAGLTLLHERFGALNVSPVYESHAYGIHAPAFFNLAVAFDVSCGPLDLKLQMREIEAICGRVRGPMATAARTLDLDLLLYGERMIDKTLNLPHAEITKFAFVLRPLADLSGSLQHPLTGLSLDEMWTRFDALNHPIWQVPFDIPDFNQPFMAADF
jgi:2-amino-4-hydroxy-6-hydroxymethyldihydropteridine diphosphokinase